MKYQSLSDSLVGKTITIVRHTTDDVWFETTTGTVHWQVEGDCCSMSWIEHVDLDLVMGQVLGVEEISMPNVDPVTRHPEVQKNLQEEHRFYGVKVTTEKGEGLIEFRNSSNGYYGGSMMVMSNGVPSLFDYITAPRT